jgi:hypothetical protein
MYDIDKIMDMLDSGNPVEIQEQGIELGKRIHSINVFLQPENPGHKKNVWRNCAKILASKEDELLITYTKYLLEWLQDLNWPGSLEIMERLKSINANGNFVLGVNETVDRATRCNEQIWLDYLSELLDNESLKSKLSEKTIVVLQKHYHNWGENC